MKILKIMSLLNLSVEDESDEPKHIIFDNFITQEMRYQQATDEILFSDTFYYQIPDIQQQTDFFAPGDNVKIKTIIFPYICRPSILKRSSKIMKIESANNSYMKFNRESYSLIVKLASEKLYLYQTHLYVPTRDCKNAKCSLFFIFKQ